MRHDPLCDRLELEPATCPHCMCIARERARYAIEQVLEEPMPV